VDKNTIIQAIIGLITLGISSVLGVAFSTITELKHEQDLMTVKVQQAESQLVDLWHKYNKAQEDQLQFMQLYYTDRIEVERRICEPIN
jgi:hypothetical protein